LAGSVGLQLVTLGNFTSTDMSEPAGSAMAPDEVVMSYLPEGVREIIGIGVSSFVGDLGDGQVLKYPLRESNWQDIRHEARIYEILGLHPRILRCFGFDSRGLRLQKATNGTVQEVLRHGNVTERQRLRWSRQLAEAVAYIHTREVIHRDISTRNCFLDNNMDLLPGDFQGPYTDAEGILRDGLALENTKVSLARPTDHSDARSDLFATGCVIYEIMVSHEMFPELDSLDDEDEIVQRYTAGHFPDVKGVMGQTIIRKCWFQKYQTARQCAQDLKDAEAESVGRVNLVR